MKEPDSKEILYGSHQRRPRQVGFVAKEYHLGYWLDATDSNRLWELLDERMVALPSATVDRGFEISSWELEEHKDRGVNLQFKLRLTDAAPEQTLLQVADDTLLAWINQILPVSSGQ